MVQQLSTNTFCPTKWIVSATLSDATHTTIAAALTSASSGDVIGIRGGSYTENLTLKAGVTLVGLDIGAVTIVGKCSMTATGAAYIEECSLTTNSDFCLSVTGSNNAAIILKDCKINPSNNTAIQVNNGTAGAGIECYNCTGLPASTFAVYTLTTGTLVFGNCYFDAGSASVSSTANTAAAGTLVIRHSRFTNPLTTSGTASVEISHTFIDTSGTNSVCITNGSASSLGSFDNCYSSGSASAISTSGTFNSFNDVVISSNTNAITGAGTFNYFGLNLVGSSKVINTTTQSGGQYIGQNASTTIAAGFVGEYLTASATAVSVTINTSVNITSLALTAGIWDICGVCISTITSPVGMTRVATTLATASGGGTGIEAAPSCAISIEGMSATQSPANCIAGPANVVVAAGATTTVYLVAKLSGTSGTISTDGQLRARRIA